MDFPAGNTFCNRQSEAMPFFSLYPCPTQLNRYAYQINFKIWKITLDFQDYTNYLLSALVLLSFWSANFRTSMMIEEWAKEKEVIILSKIYIPWHWYFPLCGGFHPANFRVNVKKTSGETETYWIAGGGLTWLRKEIKVKNGNIEKRITM